MTSFFAELTASDWAAWYAAIIATIALLWEIVKWQSDLLRLRVTVGTGYKIVSAIPGLNDDRYHVNVSVSNVGGRKTTVTQLGFVKYDSGIKKFLNRLIFDNGMI